MKKLPKFTHDRRQEDSWSCGAVASAVALEIVGFDPVAASETVRAGLAVTPLDGVDPRTIEAFFRRFGLGVQSGDMDVADLVHHCAVGRPVIALITFDSVGHWVVVYAASNRWVHYHCPVRGLVRESVSKFRGQWKDVGRCGTAYQGFGVAVIRGKA